MKTAIVLTSLVALLAACAGVAPSDLKSASVEKSILLTSAVEYDQYHSLAGNHMFHTIQAGRYTAKYEDARGLYYEGAGQCFSIRVELDSLKKEGKPQPAAKGYRCGIFMPSAATEEPKLYFYRDPEVSRQIFNNTTVQAVDSKGAPSASPGATIGTGLGVGIAAAWDAAELKNLHFYDEQPKPGQIRQALQ